MNEIAAANALKINQSNKLSEMLTGEESTISVILHATTKSISAQVSGSRSGAFFQASETGMLYSKIAELEQEQKNIKEMTDFHELETDSLNYKIDQLVSDRVRSRSSGYCL